MVNRIRNVDLEKANIKKNFTFDLSYKTWLRYEEFKKTNKGFNKFINLIISEIEKTEMHHHPLFVVKQRIIGIKPTDLLQFKEVRDELCPNWSPARMFNFVMNQIEEAPTFLFHSTESLQTYIYPLIKHSDAAIVTFQLILQKAIEKRMFEIDG